MDIAATVSEAAGGLLISPHKTDVHWEVTARVLKREPRCVSVVEGENDRREGPLADPELDVQSLRRGPSHRTL
jgi:hypothetical protein